MGSGIPDSSRHPSVTTGGVGGRRARPVTVRRSRPLARATPPNQAALGLGRRSKVVPVDLHQAEGGPVAEDPLEVVEQAPVEVAADVDAVVEAAAAPRPAPGSRTRSAAASSSVPIPFSVT